LLTNTDTLVGCLDEALRRRAFHPWQAHVEASRQAELAPFGTEIDLGIDRMIGRQRNLHAACGELLRRLEARGPAGREELLRIGAGAGLPGRDSLTSRRPSELRKMPARPPVVWAFAVYSTFSSRFITSSFMNSPDA
jgi:hypothetical protein